MFEHTELRRRRVLEMIALTIVTLGLYYPWWFLRRRAALNRLGSATKLALWPFTLVLAYELVTLAFTVSSPPLPQSAEPSVNELVLVGIRLAVAVLMLIQTFRVRDILEDHLHPSRDVSALVTFLFGTFYLQHKINAHLDRLQREPESA
jgi:hypothetical protein